MNNWNEYIDQALARLSRKKKPTALPQLTLGVPESTEVIISPEQSPTRRERQIKQSLSYQLLEKMRRRVFIWKSYYYFDEYNIPRLAIANDNVKGVHITERRYLVPEDRIIEASFYTDENASRLFVDVNELETSDRGLFNQLRAGTVTLQIYNQTYPIEIWFDSHKEDDSQLHALGKHKVYVNTQNAYLLRPFRNLGTEGFAALTNRLLIQAGIELEPKNMIESLLILFGNEELLRYYQSALNRYNQQASMRRSPTIVEEEELPLIITKMRKSANPHRSDKLSPRDLTRLDAVPEETYKRLAFLFETHFEETEEDLLYISLAALSLDRSAVVESCEVLKNKLCLYAETALLEEYESDQVYRFMQQLMAEEETEKEAIETKAEKYSPLEDQAYEEIIIDVLETIRDITTHPCYNYYSPIQAQLDALQETVESLTQALEDAEDKKRHREIYDMREILTRKAFETPNPRTYGQDKGEGQLSYYERLLELQQDIQQIENQMNYTGYAVALSLAKSAYLLALLNAKQVPKLHDVSNQLMELMQATPEQNYADFEREFVSTLAQLATDIHEIRSVKLTNRLMKTTNQLEQICAKNEQYTENEWRADYLKFIRRHVPEFKEEVHQVALKQYNQIVQHIDYQFQLIDTFISGVSVPALLPAQLHESGVGLQTFLVQQLQKYLSMQNLQLHTVPGRESQLQSLVGELVPVRSGVVLEQLKYFFMNPF